MAQNIVVTPELVEVYENDIYSIVDSFIESETLRDPDFLNNKGFFPLLINHLSRYAIKPILNNTHSSGNRYNIEQLDIIFNIYIQLVYKYKSNKRPSILEFSLLTSIDRYTINLWSNGDNRELTIKEMDIVKSWYTTCEQALTDSDGSPVMSIFLLKSKYGYVEQPQEIIVSQGQNVLTAENLPQLGNVSRDIVDNSQ